MYLYEAIEKRRRYFGDRLTIMGHHYQDETVIRHTDLRGDSLELARLTAAVDSRYIVFCGVYFMAESTALLAKAGQETHLPEPSAECSMAMMSPADLMQKIISGLSLRGRKIVPLAYINSTLAVKAVVGRHGGALCTSANAVKMLEWALREGDAVFFLPDRNLADNMADLLGLPASERCAFDLKDRSGRIPEEAHRARLLIWPGFCSIHTRFNLRQIERVRAEYPGIKVITHPECTPQVTAASDFSGSTSFIIRYVEDLPQGARVAIGTEINLVERLAARHKDRVTVVPLVESACTHMAQTTEERLAAALDALVEREKTGLTSPFAIHIDEKLKAPAKAALERMFSVCA